MLSEQQVVMLMNDNLAYI